MEELSLGVLPWFEKDVIFLIRFISFSLNKARFLRTLWYTPKQCISMPLTTTRLVSTLTTTPDE